MQNIETKNKFDEIIEKMINENITCIDDSLYNLEHTEKISKVFKTVDSTGSFSNLDLSRKPKMEHLKSVITMLKNYVKVGEVKKKEAGEVMTPLELVKEMLATLPEDVWSNPNLKWLDSCNGSGPFLVMVIYKLMVGLKDWESDEEKRYKHIVENMIYAGELQPKNMFLFVSAIDPFDEYNLNIYTGSFLEKEFDIHMKTVWGLEKFSIVVGNPPFNQMIDMLFLQKSYKISDRVLYVHPSTWLLDEKGKQKKFTDTKELIKDSLESIELFNGNKIFGIQLFIPCVFTYVDKNKTERFIKCVDKINDVVLIYSDINQINKFSDIDIYPKIKDKIINLTKDNIDNHKIFNTSTKRNNTPGKISKYSHLNTLNEYYINIAQIRGHVNLNSDKNMLLDDFYTIVTRDNIVERVISNHMFFKFDNKEESENFLLYLKTNFARFCLSMYKNNSQLECGEMSLIPWLDFNIKWTDDLLYKHFNLYENEIEFILKIVPKYY
jgi:hypothetical protein